MSGIILISSGNEEHLPAANMYTGRVAAAIDASTTGFRVRQMQTKNTMQSKKIQFSLQNEILVISDIC